MGDTPGKKHIDNDNVKERKNNNDIDNDNVNAPDFSLRKLVLKEIPSYKLDTIQNFMFGSPSKLFGNCTVFVNPAIKQIERFTYVWMNDISEEARKIIINYMIGYDGDNREREYGSYLNSPVWKYVSSILKLSNNYTCQKCGLQFSPAHLVVHHLSYNHIGSELKYPDDITVLCTDCHLIVHNIKESE